MLASLPPFLQARVVMESLVSAVYFISECQHDRKDNQTFRNFLVSKTFTSEQSNILFGWSKRIGRRRRLYFWEVCFLFEEVTFFVVVIHPDL